MDRPPSGYGSFLVHISLTKYESLACNTIYVCIYKSHPLPKEQKRFSKH